MQSNLNSLLLFLLLGMGLGIVGVWMLIRGHWPHRTGNTPHCRKCDYILIGNDSGVCPECGTKLTPESIIHGERHIRPRRIFGGAMLLLLGLLTAGIFVADRVGHIQWHHYWPFGWVLHDLSSSSGSVSERAFFELTRRENSRSLSAQQKSDWVDKMLKDLGLPAQRPDGLAEFWLLHQWFDLESRAKNGSLSTAQLIHWADRNIEMLKARRWLHMESSLVAELWRLLPDARISPAQHNAAIELALARQNDSVIYQGGEVWMDMLADQWAAHNLTAEQETRFFDNMLRLALKTRPQVNPGSRVPYIIEHSGRGPNAWQSRIAILGQWVDGKKVGENGGSSGGSIGDGSFGTTIGPQPPGHHQLRIQISVKIGGGDMWNPQTPIFKTRELSLTSDFEVLPQVHPIALVKSPDAATMAKCIRAEDFRIEPNSDYWLDGEIVFAQLPVNGAFDVFARTHDGREYALGHAYATKGRGGSYGIGVMTQGTRPTTLPTTIDIILRSSPAAAEETIDMTEIWDGQIVIPNVPVKAPTTQPSGH